MPDVPALANCLDRVFGVGRQHRSEIQLLVTCNSKLALQGIRDHLAGRWHGAPPLITLVSPVVASRERILACDGFWGCEGAESTVH